MRIKLCALLLALAAGCSSPAPTTSTATPTATGTTPAAQPTAGAFALEAAYEQVITQVMPSVVQINTKVGLGSGIVYDTAGHIVTNAHVVGQATQLEVTLATGGASRPAELVASFPEGDLAVIKVSDATGLRPAKFADSAKARVGQIVLAMGNPLGLSGSVTNGIISALGRTVSEPPPGGVIANAIQTSAAINPGNSGGALVNLSAEVVGIPTLAATNPELGDSAAPGIGFAIPSNTATDIADQIIKDGKVTNTHRAALGIQGSGVLGPDGRPLGVQVVSVVPNGGAAQAGIKPGDIILSVNGVETPTMGALAEVLAGLQPGDQAKVEIVRPDGSTQTVTVTLGELQAQ
ncbi:S1C family serine protease [Nonomuraea soli]|uniref:S1-C subfamily serine protease n=1 Tax=Nonomuraea soli TaxID=1032476 RepID=A0A7W0CKE7_9ACTN|nr:trypsin-like peptidase domain-containing protein [Nonomuraea soli]MBA2892770.1 S1-C subfamily serine protease [Nonomuraea soli]